MTTPTANRTLPRPRRIPPVPRHAGTYQLSLDGIRCSEELSKTRASDHVVRPAAVLLTSYEKFILITRSKFFPFHGLRLESPYHRFYMVIRIARMNIALITGGGFRLTTYGRIELSCRVERHLFRFHSQSKTSRSMNSNRVDDHATPSLHHERRFHSPNEVRSKRNVW